MQILIDGEESVDISVHYDKGKVPEILVSNLKEDRVATKEIIIGKMKIQLFERGKNAKS